jgi:hypothetical protein
VEKKPTWHIGLWIGLGALFKWPIYLLWLFLLPFVAWDRRLLGGILISLLGLLPAVIWNMQHEWATFKHVGATLQGGSGTRAEGNFWEFIGAQAALLSPIFFYLLLLSYKEKKKELAVAVLITFLPLSFAAIAAMFMKVQGNWITFIYPTAALLAAHVGVSRPRWLQAGWVVSLLFVAAILFFIPLKHNRDWDHLPKLLTEAGYRPDKHFLFSDKYQNTALLSFYSPGQKRAYFLNLKGDRLNQYSFWPGPKEKELGKDGFYASFEANPTDLSPYFQSLGEPKKLPLSEKKALYLQEGIGYNGHTPDASVRY